MDVMTRTRAPASDAFSGLDFASIDGWVFDLDGTLVLTDGTHEGYRPLTGAIALLDLLRATGRPFVIMTNGAYTTPADYIDILTAAGFDVRPGEMMTPSSVAADVLARARAKRVLVLGLPGVWRPLAEAGMEVVQPHQLDEDEVAGLDAVFLGWDPDFNLHSLRVACNAVWAGARLYVSSLAPYFATARGRTISVSSAIAAAVTRVTGKRPTLIGKPSNHAMRCLQRALGLPMERICVVGDDPRIEVGMARRAGAWAVGVETGIADRARFARAAENTRPHAVYPNIDALRTALTKA